MASSVLDIGFVLQSPELAVSEQEIVTLLNESKWRLVLIEINPFGKCSGSALFSWLEKVLLDGPLEFRLAHEEHLL